MATLSQMIPASFSTMPQTSTTLQESTTWMDTASHQWTFLPWRTKMHSWLRNFCFTRTFLVWWFRKSTPLIDVPTLFSLQRRRKEATGCLYQGKGTSRLWGCFCGILCRVGIRTKPDHHQENCCGHWDWLHVPDWCANVPLPSCRLCQVGPLRVFNCL